MKKAFTLAEVLLTLGIIGVVAALVIPNLVAKYQKKQIEVKLVKFYSAFSQAYKLAEVKNGASSGWEYVNEYNVRKVMRYVIPEMKTIKTCYNEPDCNNYLSKYSAKIKNASYSGFRDVGNINLDLYAIFPDGSILYNHSDGFLNTINSSSSFLIDLNGEKGPNKAWIDIYEFWIVYNKLIKNTSITSTGASQAQVELKAGEGRNIYPGGYGWVGKSGYGCTIQRDWSCTAKIASYGWKIGDDYPWN